MTMDPVRLLPHLVERVWGRTDLAQWFGTLPPATSTPATSTPATLTSGALGEAWLSDLGCGVVGGGTLGARIEADRAGMLGATAGPSPILLKLLFPSAPLSVQVHPTDAAARAAGIAAFGKNEAWHVLEAAPDAVVWAGFATQVTPGRLRAAVADGSVMGLMHEQAVQVGDTVSVPAGTVHAIGPGLVLLEVQDPVQITYRLFDYGRDRPLQLEEGMGVADLGSGRMPRAEHLQPTPRQVLASASRFMMERLVPGSGVELRPDGARYHIVVALTGGVALDGAPLGRGAAAFIPAAGTACHLTGEGPAAVALVHPGPGLSPCVALP